MLILIFISDMAQAAVVQLCNPPVQSTPHAEPGYSLTLLFQLSTVEYPCLSMEPAVPAHL